MNQEKIGKFIAKMRKEAGYTQAKLAEKLGISDRAVSKWETGRSLPDASIMLELCELLNINVNELLTGEHLNMENYNKHAEENLLEMKKREEESNKYLLRMEYVIGYLCTISFLVLIFTASYAVKNRMISIALIIVAFIVFFIGMFYGLKIEREVGYYECKHCQHHYIPTTVKHSMAVHMGRTRYMRCPKCGKMSWQKKVLTK